MNSINRLAKRKGFPYWLRAAMLILFILIMFVSYFGLAKIINPNHKIALFVIWTLWWPILYLSLLFFARAWCGFLCPITFANEAGNKFRKGKYLNIVKWGFLAYVLFFIIVLAEQVSGLFLSYNITLIFIVLFFAAAFIFGLLFSRWSFCSIICPIGVILSVFSRLSFIGLRIKEEKCRVCTTRECMKGGIAAPCPTFNAIPEIKTNKTCLLCTNCIKNCPHDSAQIRFVKPGKEVVDRIAFTKAESIFIIALLGMTFILNSRGTELFRKLFSWLSGIVLLSVEVSGTLLRAIDFILAIGLTLVAFGLLCFITGRTAKTNFKDSIKEYGYVYLPLAFAILFFTIVFGFLGPPLHLPEQLISLSKYVILFLGAGWSAYFAYKLAHKKFGTAIHIFTIIIISGLWLIYLIPGPLNMFPEMEEIVIAEEGKALKMQGYSMGFLPNTIVARKGQEIVLEIYNKDIMHAFDINEFNVHKVLMGGMTTTIKFTPNKTGEFMYYCNIPGHTEAGMRGKLIVEE